MPFKNQQFDPLFDTIAIPAAGLTFSFFTIAHGSFFTGAVVKDYLHSNLPLGNRLESGRSFHAKGMILHARQNTQQAGAASITVVDFKKIKDGTLFLQVGENEYGYYPCSQIPGGCAGIVYETVLATDTAVIVNNGLSSVANFFPFEVPIVIQENKKIIAKLQIPVALTAVADLVFSFVGTMYRDIAE